ncbi:neprilysin-2-like isoform X4 [Phymastichus coffea]|uniref:neprilysin-2-like isoform X4 n=1 Tax=Phymastichus coffea TaxID=108790 RepID=UPI00273BB9AE|nr:neprilysin-2-like isoform X4 [Phymastichus coffea]
MESLIDVTWWKKRTSLERRLTIFATCAILVSTVLVIGILIMASTTKDYHTTLTMGLIYPVTTPSTTAIPKEEPSIIEKPPVGDVCSSAECIHTASSILDNMDPTVKPCDDFYHFACGNFLKNTIIPDDQEEVDTFGIVSNKLQTQLRNIIEEENFNNTRSLRLAKILYETCMNQKLIEEQGLNPLHKILKELGGWPVLMGDKWNDTDFDWKASIYKNRRYGYSIDLFISFDIDVDQKNNTKRVVYLDQASLGLSQKYLLQGLENEIVRAYYDYMVDLAVILGADGEESREQLKESLELEIKLANISVPSEKRRNVTDLYNPMTIRQLHEKYPSIPWLDYINNILSPSALVDEDEVVIIYAPSYISNLERLLQQTPKRVQANYILWRVVVNSVGYLTDEIRKRQLAYYTVVSGRTERGSRWKECVKLIRKSFSKAIGAAYVKKYFDEESKKAAIEMIAGIRQEFKKILNMIDWMDDKTRKAALDKATSMEEHIAYPIELLDSKKVEELYKKLEISPNNYLQSRLNLTIYGDDYTFSQLKKPVNKSDWIAHGRPTWVNAFYSFNENSIQFPAGILQGVFFNNERPKYMNYGAIGFIVGHEITHGFDDEGRQFNKDGNLVDWWQAKTKQKYLEKAQCIIDQYSNYTAREVNMNLNGINTQGENIADNGGIKQAYYAYNEWERRNGPQEPRLPGLEFTPQQMFWISTANTWCCKYRPQSLKMDITTGEHSPNEFRVIGPLSNMPEFSKDFNCPVGSRMNPEKKCSVW